MSSRIRIGVACPIPAERATLMEWLDAAGYEPVPMIDLGTVLGALEARPMEALVADAALLAEVELPYLVRTLGINRPLVLVGEAGGAAPAVAREASWLDRPVTEDALLMSVALALAEGRPARRSPRRLVSSLGSSVDGVSAKVVDVSAEGVRLEIGGLQAATLPPLFTMRVPAFGVVTTVKRVWVAQPAHRMLWCGGTVIRSSPRGAHTWRALVDNAPSSKMGVLHEGSTWGF